MGKLQRFGKGGIASPRPEAMAQPFLRALKARRRPRLKIAIIGAMVPEVELLRDRIKGMRTSSHAGNEFFEGTLAGAPVVLTACGVGKVHAAARTQAMIDRFAPTHIIFTGIAGAIDERINIGDVVVSTDCVQYDVSLTAFDRVPGLVPGFKEVGFAADERLCELAVASIHAVTPEVKVFKGRIATGDTFVASSRQKRSIQETFGALCCEMEGAAVAQAACVNKIPFVVVRTISDKADDAAVDDYPAFEVKASHQGAVMVEEMCRRLCR